MTTMSPDVDASISSEPNWGQCEGLIPRGEQFNPCRYVKGREFSQVTGYEALALEIEDTLKVLGEPKHSPYERERGRRRALRDIHLYHDDREQL